MKIKAIGMLSVATLFWGLSFPVFKAMSDAQAELLGAGHGLFISSSSLTLRFLITALLLLLVFGFKKPSRLELEAGIGLGIFGGFASYFQMDGLRDIPATSSAFLTQTYCLIIPIFAALQKRSFPSKTILASCLLVVAGVAVLSGLDTGQLRLGVGESKTLIASAFFAAQILWLERPRFHQTRSAVTTLVMSVIVAALCLSLSLYFGASFDLYVQAYSRSEVISLLFVLSVFSTFAAYYLMTRYQPKISATEAGLVYCGEPLFASSFALFLPSILSAWIGLGYSNESLSKSLVTGGLLILAANLLIIRQASRA